MISFLFFSFSFSNGPISLSIRGGGTSAGVSFSLSRGDLLASCKTERLNIIPKFPRSVRVAFLGDDANKKRIMWDTFNRASGFHMLAKGTVIRGWSCFHFPPRMLMKRKTLLSGLVLPSRAQCVSKRRDHRRRVCHRFLSRDANKNRALAAVVFKEASAARMLTRAHFDKSSVKAPGDIPLLQEDGNIADSFLVISDSRGILTLKKFSTQSLYFASFLTGTRRETCRVKSARSATTLLFFMIRDVLIYSIFVRMTLALAKIIPVVDEPKPLSLIVILTDDPALFVAHDERSEQASVEFRNEGETQGMMTCS